MKQRRKMIAVLVIALIVAVAAIALAESDYGLTLGKVKAHADSLKNDARQHEIEAGLLFMGVFVALSLFLPGAALLTLLGGYVFGVVRATLYADAATTIAAVACFVVTRKLSGKWVQKRYAEQLESFNGHIAEYGYLYLLVIRFVPMVPFFWINLTAGLTKIKVRTFAWTTAVGSVPGIIIFSYAGESLFSINAVEDIFTTDVIVALALLILLLGCVFIVRTVSRKGWAKVPFLR